MNGLTILRSTLDNLVVDVGYVAHISYIITARLEPAVHHVEHHQYARVAEMAVVVHRHAAHIHAGLARHNRHKFLLVSVESVVDFQHE